MDHESLYQLIKEGKIQVNNYSPPIERFWSQINKDGPLCPGRGQCWVWTGLPQPSGYVRIRIDTRFIRVHRYSYETFVGPIASQLTVCHHCDNKICVRPSHLFLGTNTDNQADKIRKGRQAKGSGNGRSVLTEAKVAEMRRLRSEQRLSFKKLASRFGVCLEAARLATLGVTWRHV